MKFVLDVTLGSGFEIFVVEKPNSRSMADVSLHSSWQTFLGFTKALLLIDKKVSNISSKSSKRGERGECVDVGVCHTHQTHIVW